MLEVTFYIIHFSTVSFCTLESTLSDIASSIFIMLPAIHFRIILPGEPANCSVNKNIHPTLFVLYLHLTTDRDSFLLCPLPNHASLAFLFRVPFICYVMYFTIGWSSRFFLLVFLFVACQLFPQLISDANCCCKGTETHNLSFVGRT